MKGLLDISLRVGVCCFLLCLLGSCQRTKPQAPANRQEQVDSTELAMILLTQRMVEKANTDLALYVKELDSAYTLAPRGYWYRKTVSTQGDTLRKNDEVTVRMLLHDLYGNFLEDAEANLIIGKQTLPIAIEDYLLHMCVGEKASLIIPWYDAYGTIGTNTIPAYTNIRVAIEVIE